MIHLAFTIDREVFCIEIKGREVWYGDRKWGKLLRLVPKDEKFIRKIKFSRNKIPQHFIELFNLTKEEQGEYDNAKDEKELSEICIRDARKKGAILIKNGIS